MADKQKITFYPTDDLFTLIQGLPKQTRSAEISRRLLESFARDGVNCHSVDNLPEVSTSPVDLPEEKVSTLCVDTQSLTVSTPDSSAQSVQNLQEQFDALLEIVETQGIKINALEDSATTKSLASPTRVENNSLSNSEQPESDQQATISTGVDTAAILEALSSLQDKVDEVVDEQVEQAKQLVSLQSDLVICQDNVAEFHQFRSDLPGLDAFEEFETSNLSGILETYPALTQQVDCLEAALHKLTQQTL